MDRARLVVVAAWKCFQWCHGQGGLGMATKSWRSWAHAGWRLGSVLLASSMAVEGLAEESLFSDSWFLRGTSTSRSVDVDSPLSGESFSPSVIETDDYRLASFSSADSFSIDPVSAALSADSWRDRTQLTGNWGGYRDALAESGVTIEASSTNIYQGVASGGINNEFAFGGRGDLFLKVDGGKAGLQEGLLITLHGEMNYGDSVNRSTGALLPISFPQVFPTGDAPSVALSNVSVTQFLSESMLVYLGKINTLDSFIRPYRGNSHGIDGFMNGAFLFPTVMGRVIPYSTYGGGVIFLREMQPILSINVFDTNSTPTTSGFDEFFNNGASLYIEGRIPTSFFGMEGLHSLSGAYSSGTYRATDPGLNYIIERIRGLNVPAPQETGSWAFEYSFSQALWVDATDSKRSWGLFGSLGIADGNPNPIRWGSDIGIGGSSPLVSRPNDKFGVGYYYLGVSSELRQIGPIRTPLRDEHGVELFYNYQVTPTFQLTPDLQIITPGISTFDTSVNVALRANLIF
ncbi:porin [Planctopirus hydrillae]|uniref:Porin n=2 Tax=Planctopirus hydrillae TaxID=1841610 RepID=A0A1C3E6N0_9PLAN|nr:porin [Planctopirus hydrillae]